MNRVDSSHSCIIQDLTKSCFGGAGRVITIVSHGEVEEERGLGLYKGGGGKAKIEGRMRGWYRRGVG